MDDKSYDVFISHSSADKKPYVENLAAEIRKVGLVAFYDTNSIAWGDSIKAKIDEGLKHCRRAIVVISDSYFDKEWTEYEIKELIKRQDEEGHKIIMPILYNVSKTELINHYPSLADIKYIYAKDYSYKEIAQRLCRDIVNNK